MCETLSPIALTKMPSMACGNASTRLDIVYFLNAIRQ
jgi:hypothetical protein